MKINIFQIDNSKDVNHLAFWPLDFTEANGGINPAIYDIVFNGEVQANNLEDVFRIFNSDERPNTYHGRSLSVSDIVEVKEDTPTTEKGFYFCDSLVFKKVDFNINQNSVIDDNDECQDFTPLSM